MEEKEELKQKHVYMTETLYKEVMKKAQKKGMNFSNFVKSRL